MAINFSGEFTTPRSQDEVFDFLSDPNKFAPLLPDFQSMSMQDATHFTVKVKVGVGNIRGSAEIKMELSEAVKPQRAHYKGQGSAVGSQVTVTAGFDLSSIPEGTRVGWQGETSVFGKLASMAGGMLEPLGRKNIQKLIDGLQSALAQPLAAAVPVGAPGFSTAKEPLPQSGTSGPTSAMERAPGEAPDVSTARSDQSREGASAPAERPVEAPGLSPANSDQSKEGASAPAEDKHGD